MNTHTRLALLTCTFILALAVAAVFFKQSVLVAIDETTQDGQVSMLAAARGSYSKNRFRAHREYDVSPDKDEPEQVDSTKPQTNPAPTAPAPAPAATTTAPAVNPPVVTAPMVTQPTVVPTAPTTTAASTPVVAKVPTTTPTVAPTAVPAPNLLGKKFGVSVGATLYWLSSAELEKELSDLASLKVGWIRLDIEWDQIQAKGRDSYDWTVTDRVIKAALAKGFKLLPIIAYAPTWARPASCASFTCAPANISDYTNFARAAVTRYAPMGIHAWEIWNEPNVKQFWLPKPDVAFYTQMLKSAYATIKAADSSAIVVTGGTAPAATSGGNYSPTDFLSGIYANGGKGSFDAIGAHPYSYPALPSNLQSWNAWSQMANTNPSLRTVASTNGEPSKPIWMTEFGAPTGGPGSLATLTNFNFAAAPDHVDEVLQAQMMQEALNHIKTMSNSDAPIFWYSYKDLGTTKTTNENFFGLLRNDGTSKPSYTVLKNALK